MGHSHVVTLITEKRVLVYTKIPLWKPSLADMVVPMQKKKNAVHNLIHSLTGLHTKILALEHVSLCRNVFIR